MQKSGLIIVIFGLLIVTGLVISIIGNQVTLEGISQGNGEVNLEQVVTIAVDFDRDETSTGIVAVQVMEFKENTISMKILDPSNNEIVFREINENTVEEKFEVLETGTYELIIQSSNDEGIYVTGAMGPLPDENKKNIISITSTSTLLIGMVGLVGIGIYGIKNRKRSV